jgi:hypothetical protein
MIMHDDSTGLLLHVHLEKLNKTKILKRSKRQRNNNNNKTKCGRRAKHTTHDSNSNAFLPLFSLLLATRVG